MADVVDNSVVEVLGEVALVVDDTSAAAVQWFAAGNDAVEQEPGQVDTVGVRLGEAVAVVVVIKIGIAGLFVGTTCTQRATRADLVSVFYN